MFELRGPENPMSPVRALSSYLLSPQRSRNVPRPRSIQLQHFVPELGCAFGTCALRSRARACPAPSSPGRAKPASGARECRVISHPDRTLQLRRRRCEQREAKEQRFGPPASITSQLPKAKRFYIYATFAIELALRFRPFKVKNATGPFSRTRKIRIGLCE